MKELYQIVYIGLARADIYRVDINRAKHTFQLLKPLGTVAFKSPSKNGAGCVHNNRLARLCVGQFDNTHLRQRNFSWVTH